jgi:hypothetical protein
VRLLKIFRDFYSVEAGMVWVGKIERSWVGELLFGPCLRTSHGNREQGGAVVKVLAAGHAHRVTLTRAMACFIGRLKFEGKDGLLDLSGDPGQRRWRSMPSELPGSINSGCVPTVLSQRFTQNAFRDKYERYLSATPFDADRKRKALSAVAAKMARVAYAVVKHGTDCQCFFEHRLPSGSIPLARAVEATSTS